MGDEHPTFRPCADHVLEFDSEKGSYQIKELEIPPALANKQPCIMFVFPTHTYIDDYMYCNKTGKVSLQLPIQSPQDELDGDFVIIHDNIHLRISSNSILNTNTLKIMTNAEYNKPLRFQFALDCNTIYITKFDHVDNPDDLPRVLIKLNGQGLFNTKNYFVVDDYIIIEIMEPLITELLIIPGARYTLIQIPCEFNKFAIFKISLIRGFLTKAAIHSAED